jgi:hypothetical protein
LAAAGFASFGFFASFSLLLCGVELEEDSGDEAFSLVDVDFSVEEPSGVELSEEDFSAAAAVSRWRLRVP